MESVCVFTVINVQVLINSPIVLHLVISLMRDIISLSSDLWVDTERTGLKTVSAHFRPFVCDVMWWNVILTLLTSTVRRRHKLSSQKIQTTVTRWLQRPRQERRRPLMVSLPLRDSFFSWKVVLNPLHLSSSDIHTEPDHVTRELYERVLEELRLEKLKSTKANAEVAVLKEKVEEQEIELQPVVLDKNITVRICIYFNIETNISYRVGLETRSCFTLHWRTISPLEKSMPLWTLLSYTFPLLQGLFIWNMYVFIFHEHILTRTGTVYSERGWKKEKQEESGQQVEAIPPPRYTRYRLPQNSLPQHHGEYHRGDKQETRPRNRQGLLGGQPTEGGLQTNQFQNRNSVRRKKFSVDSPGIHTAEPWQ